MKRFYLTQADLFWEDPESNREMLGEMTQHCHDGVIILPEMFSTGFSMSSKRLAEPMNGTTITWLQSQAARTGSAICGSQIVVEHDCYYNRFLWADADQALISYDKRHLFRMADEHHYYSPGKDRVLVPFDDMTLLPQVCYDLRFPVWSRRQHDYDILLYVANWPAARREQWLALLRARAIENLCYVIAVNRVGLDGNDIRYSGDSCVIDFRGETLLDMSDQVGVGSIALDLEALAAYRQDFPAYLDADNFEIDV